MNMMGVFDTHFPLIILILKTLSLCKTKNYCDRKCTITLISFKVKKKLIVNLILFIQVKLSTYIFDDCF